MKQALTIHPNPSFGGKIIGASIVISTYWLRASSRLLRTHPGQFKIYEDQNDEEK